MSYLEKYKPSNSSEVIGHKKIIEEVLKKWLTNWNNETKKSLLLSGSCGIGKTLIIVSHDQIDESFRKFEFKDGKLVTSNYF